MIVTVHTPRGRPAKMAVRERTSDLATVGATFAGVAGSGLVDEYGLRDTYVTGWALDVGAHIGAVTLALLLDNPDCRVVAVEALPDNVAVLHENLALNGVEDRCVVVTAAAWKGRGIIDVEWGYEGSEIAETNRYIGSVSAWLDAPAAKRSVTVPRTTLRELLRHTDGRFAFVKIDCEGCEFPFLRGPSLKAVDRITGEWHQRDGDPADLATTLRAAGFDVQWSEGIGGGPFRAVRA